MLIKYENSTFKLLDSLYNLDHTTFQVLDSLRSQDNVVWENFILEVNGKLILDRDSSYYYTGAGIIIE